jgi:hypothetical protein
MKFLALLLLLAVAAPSPEMRYFRYQRPIQTSPGAAGQTCAILDPAIFPHAAPGLADLRLYRGDAQNADPSSASSETPYILQASAPTVLSTQPIAPLNLGSRAGQTVFDAPMPPGSFSDLELNLTGVNFLATVTVSGSQAQGGPSTRIGAYTIFDLSSQKLGRSTVLHLPVSDFPFLHFSIAGPIAPTAVTGLTVVTTPKTKTRYVTVAASGQVTRSGRDSVIDFTVPAHTPVDRIVFVPGAEPAAFSRDVTVKIAPIASPPKNDAAFPSQPVVSSGNLLRLHRVQEGRRIDEERLTVDSPMADSFSTGSFSTDYETPSQWTITIENGDDAPIELTQVRLEMRERNLCFDQAAGAAYTLYYGDAALAAPTYDYASLFARQPDAASATFGPEQPNPSYQPRPDERPFTEKHPSLLWIALTLVVALLAIVALRTVKQTAPGPT